MSHEQIDLLEHAAAILDGYALSLRECHTVGSDGVTWGTEPEDLAAKQHHDDEKATAQRLYELAEQMKVRPSVEALQEEVERLRVGKSHNEIVVRLCQDHIATLEATNAAQVEQLAKLEGALRDCKENGGRPERVYEITTTALLQSSTPPEPQAGVELTDERKAFEDWMFYDNPNPIGLMRPMDAAWKAWEARALNQRQAVKAEPAKGVNGGVEAEKLEVVVTTTEAGRCVAVTRQNSDGQIKEVIWEAEPLPAAQGVPKGAPIILLKQAKSIIQRWCEQYPEGARGNWLPPARVPEWLEDFDAFMLAIAEQPEKAK